MPAHADADAYGRAVSTTWALSITAAEASLPDSRASRATWLAALLDPAGHPDQFWASPAVITYLNEPTDNDEHTDGDRDEEVGWATVRAVTIHALTQRAVTETMDHGRDPGGPVPATPSADLNLTSRPHRPEHFLETTEPRATGIPTGRNTTQPIEHQQPTSITSPLSTDPGQSWGGRFGGPAEPPVRTRPDS